MAFTDLLQQVAARRAQPGQTVDVNSLFSPTPFKEQTFTTEQSTSYDPSSGGWTVEPGGTTTRQGWEQEYGYIVDNARKATGGDIYKQTMYMAQLFSNPQFVQAFQARYPNADLKPIGEMLGRQAAAVQSNVGQDFGEQLTIAGLAAITGGAAGAGLGAAGASATAAGIGGGAVAGGTGAALSGGKPTDIAQGAALGALGGGVVGEFAPTVPAGTGTTPGTSSYGGAGDFATSMPPAVLDTGGTPMTPAPTLPSDPSFGGITFTGGGSAIPFGAPGDLSSTLASPDVTSTTLTAPAPATAQTLTTPPGTSDLSLGLTIPGAPPPDPSSPVGVAALEAATPSGGMNLVMPDYVGDLPIDPNAGAGSGPGDAGSGVWDFLKTNKGLLIPGAVLGAQLLNKPKTPEIPQLDNLAQQLASGPGTKAAQEAAASLIPTVSTGNLPPGADALVNNAVNDAQTAIRAKYASLGMGNSTPEMQELSSAQARGDAMKFQFGLQLTQTGLAAAGVAASAGTAAANIYSLILNAQLQSDQALQNALSNFAIASALGMGLGH